MAMTTTRVLCLGNELARDDGLGLRVGRALRQLELGPGVSIELRRVVGLELLDELVGGELLIVVDASLTGRPPGVCHTLELGQTTALATAPSSCHNVGLAEVLQIASRVAPDRLPERVVVVGVEAAALGGYGVQLSPEVRAALPEAVDQVLELLGTSAEIRARGREVAAQWKGWEPAVADLLEE